MSNYANLPAPSPEQGLNRYLQEIRKFPLLEPEEEYMLAKRWVDHEDSAAAHKMVTSHLRLAAKIACRMPRNPADDHQHLEVNTGTPSQTSLLFRCPKSSHLGPYSLL